MSDQCIHTFVTFISCPEYPRIPKLVTQLTLESHWCLHLIQFPYSKLGNQRICRMDLWICWFISPSYILSDCSEVRAIARTLAWKIVQCPPRRMFVDLSGLIPLKSESLPLFLRPVFPWGDEGVDCWRIVRTSVLAP